MASGTKKPKPKPKSYLDKLPAEISTKIYEYLFARAHIVVDSEDENLVKHVHPRILFTCHKIRNQALPHLGRLMDLHVTYQKVAIMHTHLAPTILNQLRTLTICEYDDLLSHRVYGHDLSNLLPPFKNLSKLLPALQTLEIHQLEIACAQHTFWAAELNDNMHLETKTSLLALMFSRMDQLLGGEDTPSTYRPFSGFDEVLAQLIIDSDGKFQLLLHAGFIYLRFWSKIALPVTVDVDTEEIKHFGIWETIEKW